MTLDHRCPFSPSGERLARLSLGRWAKLCCFRRGSGAAGSAMTTKGRRERRTASGASFARARGWSLHTLSHDDHEGAVDNEQNRKRSVFCEVRGLSPSAAKPGVEGRRFLAESAHFAGKRSVCGSVLLDDPRVLRRVTTVRRDHRAPFAVLCHSAAAIGEDTPLHLAPIVWPGHSSVRNGDAGRPSRL